MSTTRFHREYGFSKFLGMISNSFFLGKYMYSPSSLKSYRYFTQKDNNHSPTNIYLKVKSATTPSKKGIWSPGLVCGHFHHPQTLRRIWELTTVTDFQGRKLLLHLSLLLTCMFTFLYFMSSPLHVCYPSPSIAAPPSISYCHCHSHCCSCHCCCCCRSCCSMRRLC
jgi:hypothetical protein